MHILNDSESTALRETINAWWLPERAAAISRLLAEDKELLAARPAGAGLPLDTQALLEHACRNDDLYALRRALEAGADVDRKEPERDYPYAIELAMRCGSHAVCERIARICDPSVFTTEEMPPKILAAALLPRDSPTFDILTERGWPFVEIYRNFMDSLPSGKRP